MEANNIINGLKHLSEGLFKTIADIPDDAMMNIDLFQTLNNDKVIYGTINI